MKLALGAVGRAGVAVYAAGNATAAVTAALDHYAGRLRSGRASVQVPRLLRGTAKDEATIDVEPLVTADTEQALRGEAERQDVPLELLVQHALLFYLADLDSGKVACLTVVRGSPGGRLLKEA